MSAFGDYLAAIQKRYAAGDATELTHRTALNNFLESVRKGITATNEPKRIAIGAPDFKISRGKVPLGYIETKDIGINLDEMARGEGPSGDQFLRYSTLPNWILTDYLDFRWYAHGKVRRKIRIAEVSGKYKVKPLPDGEQQLADLLASFFDCHALTVGTAKELADSMAGYTRTLQQQTIIALKQTDSEGEWLRRWLTAFRETLIPDLDDKQFADMFAQTLAYGLFAARLHSPDSEKFRRDSAARAIPQTNPFLRDFFYEITGPNLPQSVGWVMDEIVDLLEHAAIGDIRKDFGKGSEKNDPVVHFYETFLAAYDPKMREVRGVYYTPEPVVSYIVRSIDCLLKTRFNRPKGLADENTLILDPATGTATFLFYVIDLIARQFKGQPSAWNRCVDDSLLKRIFGFELLMAPYAVAHLKLGMKLKDTGYSFGSDQRLGVYLTNTLEHTAHQVEMKFAEFIAKEANAASDIKEAKVLEVVLGNPPYANFGRMNRNEWILNLLADYKRDLNEKKLNLDDDFIKFIRFAQWRIEKTGYGIVGYITNNTYLDGLTHRRMRQCLMESFNEIHILNLHGSSKKKEVAPDGSKDENVFDIQQGVAIAMFVKLPNAKGCRVFHADLWGVREIWEGDKLVGGKYRALWDSDVTSIKTELNPAAPNFFFVPKEDAGADDYNSYYSLTDVFEVFGNGIGTDRDSLFYDFDKDALDRRMREFYTPTALESPFCDNYRIENSSSYNLLTRRQNTAFSKSAIRQCLYRPFDQRWLYYDHALISRPGFDVMRHLLEKNMALLATRQVAAGGFHHAFVTRNVIDRDPLSLVTRERTQAFPLYLYPEKTELLAAAGCHPNFTQKFLKVLASKLKLLPAKPHGLPLGVWPEDILYYAYAVFHSPTYRRRYAEFLKIDFPRLPLPGDRKQFKALVDKGAELVALHLLEATTLEVASPGFFGDGKAFVDKVQYTDKDRRVWVNASHYFDAVPKNVWDFHVGGYQVCEKWLKDRKGRELNYDDMNHYRKIVMALGETIRLMSEIDALIPCWPMG